MTGTTIYKMEDGTVTTEPESGTIAFVANIKWIDVAVWAEDRNKSEPHVWPVLRGVDNV